MSNHKFIELFNNRWIPAQFLRLGRQESWSGLEQDQVHLLRREAGTRQRPGIHLWSLQGKADRKGDTFLKVKMIKCEFFV
jgi:hypothetical protein